MAVVKTSVQVVAVAVPTTQNECRHRTRQRSQSLLVRVDVRAAPLKLALQQQPNATAATVNHQALHGEPTPLRVRAVLVDKHTGVTTHATAQLGIQPLSMVEPDLVLVELLLLVDEAVKVHQREQLRDLLELLATPTPSLVRQRHTAVVVAVADGLRPAELEAQAVAEQEAQTTQSALLEPRTLVAVAVAVASAAVQVVLADQEL